MAKLSKLPNAQTPIVGVFTFNMTDTMVNTSGDEVAFGADAATVFDIMTPPPGAIVVGGVVKVETAVTGSTSTMDLGDSDDTDRYTETAATNLADPDAPATDFDMLGEHKVYAGNQAIRMTIANGAEVTVGKVHVVISMVIPGRATENLKTT